MSERFYIDMDLAPGEVELVGPEAHHLATVCRLRTDDEVTLFNGRGEQYPARILQASKRVVLLKVNAIEAAVRETPFPLEVAVSFPKGDRADFLVEKLTEVGVTRLIPLQTARSVVHPRETKLERLHRQVIEASKQCGRNRLMEIGELATWESYCVSSSLPKYRVLAHPSGSPWTGIPASEPSVIAVGPEGGFTEDEVKVAIGHGWKPISLGPRILRVETAAIVLAGLLTQV